MKRLIKWSCLYIIMYTMASTLPWVIKAIQSKSIKKHVSVQNLKHYASALYISGRKANAIFSYFTPFLDFDNRLKDTERLQEELSVRGVDADVNKIQEMWKLYKSVDSNLSTLEKTNMTIVNKMKELRGKTSTEDIQELDKLKTQFNAVKSDIRNVKEVLWDLEESVIPKLLKLPNQIDKRTPMHSSVILKQYGELNEKALPEARNHIEIGKRLGLLEYKDPMQCYLCNDAALFELGVLGYAGRVFSGSDMIRVAGSDFSRSLVVEGCGMNHESPSSAFILDNHSEVDKDTPNRMHLVGGASLISFLAMHTKQLINPKNFPIKYFSTGRQYTPFPAGATPIGLFTVCQASAVQAFVLVKDSNSEEYHNQFETLLNTVCKLYDNVCDHYQIVMRPASELRPWEAMRVSFEMWSPFTKQYIEVGHISACGDYFSKRLLIAYQTPTGRDFPSVISGTVLSVPRLLGCLLEHNPDKFVVPPKVAEFMSMNSGA